MDGGFGSDVMFGGIGDDVAILDMNDISLDMGVGEDTVQLFSTDVDLSSFSDIVSNAEIIDLDSSSSMTIDSEFLSSEEAAAMNDLTIKGEEGSTVTLDESFSVSGESIVDGSSYTVYESGDFSVSVESDVTVVTP